MYDSELGFYKEFSGCLLAALALYENSNSIPTEIRVVRQSWIKVLSALVENRHREGMDSCMEALVLSYYNSYRPDGSDSTEKITFPSAEREFDSVYYCSNRPNLSKPKNYNFKYQSFKPLQRVSLNLLNLSTGITSHF